MNRTGIFPYCRIDPSAVDPPTSTLTVMKPSKQPRGGAPVRPRTPSKQERQHMAEIDRLERQVRRTRPDSPTSPNSPQRRSRTPEARVMQPRPRSVSRDGRLRSSLTSTNAQRPRQPSRQRQQQKQPRQPSRDAHGRPGRFDASGYCPMHPDVRMAKKKRHGRGWHVQLDHCPKCVQMRKRDSQDDTESLTSSSVSSEEAMEVCPGRRPRSDSFPSRGSGRHGAREKERPPQRKGSNGSGMLRRSHRSHGSHRRDVRSRSPPSRGRPPRVVRSKSPGPVRRSFSLSSRGRRPSDAKRSKKKAPVCVDGAPFDKHGRCFVHPKVKLASKKLLGGWKIHMEYCPLCERDHEELGSEYGGSEYGSRCGSEYGSECDGGGFNQSIVSGVSQLSLDSSFRSRKSTRSMRSAADASVASRGSRGSVRSYGSRSSARSTSSWSSRSSSRRRVKNRKDESFLPLDEEGYCLRHPDVQLAKMRRRGGLKIILDFCPECAGDSLVSGGREPRRNSTASVGSSCYSGRSGYSGQSGRSHGSSSTFIERMPYIDGEGMPGHYTGLVDEVGQPNGEGRMRYMNGERFDGVWHEGTKLHGTASNKAKARGDRRREGPPRGSMPAKATAKVPPSPPPPPPPLFPAKKLPGRPPTGSPHSEKATMQTAGGAPPRRSRRDAPARGSHEEGSASTGGSSGGKRRSLSRLRRKCDEIESLLRECPATSGREAKEMNDLD